MIFSRTPICIVLTMIVFALAARPWVRASSPQQQAHVLKVETTHSTELPYLLYLPTDYSDTKSQRWPLILYLHGGSMRGSQVDQLRSVGLPHLLESKTDFPFIVVSPQCPEGEIWTDVAAIEALLERLTHDYRIDPERVYITGHSMGGRGALYFAYRMPARFAAILALSPYSPIIAWGSKLAHIPLWIFHGTADIDAPIAQSQDLIRAVEGEGGHPRFSSLDGRDHFILDVYDRPDVYEWLKQQRRNEPTESSR